MVTAQARIGAYRRLLVDFIPKHFTLIEFCANDSDSLGDQTLWKDLFRFCYVVPIFADSAPQRDQAFLGSLVLTHKPSVIIDRVSRCCEDQLYCFKILYPMLSSGGIYIIDGLQTSQSGPMGDQFGSQGGERTTNFVANVVAALAEDDVHHARRWGFASAITLMADLTESVDISPRIAAFTRRGFPYIQHLIESAKDTGDCTWELNNGGPYERKSPRLINARGAIVDAVNRQLELGSAHPPIGRVTKFTDATIMMNGVIITGDNRVVDESLYGIKQLEKVGRYCRLYPDSEFCYLNLTRDPPEVLEILEGDVVLLKQWNDSNYGHWLFEAFSRISLVAEIFDLSGLRFIISESGSPMRDIYLAALRAVGINEGQLIELNHRPVLARNLIFPSPLTEHPWLIAPRVIEFLEVVGRNIDPMPQGPSRVYASRNQFGRRSLLNEADLIQRLEKFGFTVLNCETLGFLEQVKAFGNAEIVLGNQGAALSNVVFSPRGVKLLALTNEFMGDSWFWDIVDHKQGEYVSVHGRAANPELGMQSDFSVDIEQVLSILDDLIGENI